MNRCFSPLHHAELYKTLMHYNSTLIVHNGMISCFLKLFRGIVGEVSTLILIGSGPVGYRLGSANTTVSSEALFVDRVGNFPFGRPSQAMFVSSGTNLIFRMGVLLIVQAIPTSRLVCRISFLQSCLSNSGLKGWG